jgi:hypothetical protein
MSGPYRAGQSIDDYCRACKADRQHTIVAVDGGGAPVRVMCDYCESQHNFRGGPRADVAEPRHSAPATAAVARAVPPQRDTFPVVGDRERSASPIMTEATGVDLEVLLRRIIREEAGVTVVAPAEKWRGGTLVLRPGKAGVQEKSFPIETFFHKVVMLRNRLRTLEQQVNASELPDDQKLKLQAYITGCYGSLTTFNVLFADEGDQFKGSGGD